MTNAEIPWISRAWDLRGGAIQPAVAVRREAAGQVRDVQRRDSAGEDVHGPMSAQHDYDGDLKDGGYYGNGLQPAAAESGQFNGTINRHRSMAGYCNQRTNR